MAQELVVNWHILETCNFNCGYCFAHWRKEVGRSTIWGIPEYWQKMLKELQHLPPLVHGEWDSIRLNLAGGEPMLLYRRGVLGNIMKFALDLGFELSIISNGFLMDEAFVRTWGPQLQIIGISIDSVKTEINAEIGRCTKSGRQTPPEQVAGIFSLARRVNPLIQCKINTVVNARNWQENFHPTIEKIAPDRWKVFRMLPVADSPEISSKQASFKVTDDQFSNFCERHRNLKYMITSEDNDIMTGSYLMADPLGRLYQSESAVVDYRYVYSDPVHQIGIEKAFKQIEFDNRKFIQRYDSDPEL